MIFQDMNTVNFINYRMTESSLHFQSFIYIFKTLEKKSLLLINCEENIRQFVHLEKQRGKGQCILINNLKVLKSQNHHLISLIYYNT